MRFISLNILNVLFREKKTKNIVFSLLVILYYFSHWFRFHKRLNNILFICLNFFGGMQFFGLSQHKMQNWQNWDSVKRDG